MSEGLRKSKSAEESRRRQEQRERDLSPSDRERRKHELAEQVRQFRRLVKLEEEMRAEEVARDQRYERQYQEDLRADTEALDLLLGDE